MLKALKRRSFSIQEYISSGYIVSEINSSLKAEGVSSSRKLVDQVIKNKKSGEDVSSNEINKLVSNYYDCIHFILNNKEINERNIFTLYSMLTTDLDNIIELGSLYRKGIVTIGKDVGINPELIPSRIKELINFINSNVLEDKIQTKAIISHYVFENIHPYYDYNGRMGRILHLWVLINHSKEEFWKLTFLSEAIYAYKQQLDTTFKNIVKAKKQ